MNSRSNKDERREVLKNSQYSLSIIVLHFYHQTESVQLVMELLHIMGFTN